MAINPQYKVLLIVFTLIVLGGFISPNKVDALTLTPTRFEMRGDPGQVIEGEMLLINENDTAETYYSSFANFEAQGDSGSPAFVEPEGDLGTWISVEPTSIYLAPFEQKTIPFKISIPNDAEPGGHFAVIFWGTSPGGEQGQVAIGAKTGILVLLSVSGEVREDAGILDFKTSDDKFFHKTLPVSMEYRIKNDGGDRIKPEGQIVVRNTVFIPTERLDANPSEGNALPGSIRKIKIDWINYSRPGDYLAPEGALAKFWDNVKYEWRNFAVGLYSAKLNVVYGAEETPVRKTIFFFVFPWELVIVMLVVFAVVFWGGRALLRRYNRWIIAKARNQI